MSLFTGNRIRQFIYSFFPVVLPLISGTVIHLLMARRLLPQDFAVLPQALAMVGLATTIAYIINHDVAAREVIVAGSPLNSAAAFLTGRAIFALLGVIICIIPILLGQGQGKDIKLLFLFWFLVNIGINENLSHVLRIEGKFKMAAGLYIISFILLLAGTLYLYFYRTTLFGLGMVLIFSSLATASIFIKQVLNRLKRPDPGDVKNILMRSLPITISGFALFISNWFGVIFLTASGADENLTYYFLAGKFAGAQLVLLSILYFAYIPALSQMKELDRYRIFRRWFGAMGLYVLLSSLAILFILAPLLVKFWGPQYQMVQKYYLYYLPWVLFACFSYYMGLFIYSDGLTNIIGKFQWILAISTVFCVILSFNKWGAISLPAAEGVAMLIAGLGQYYLWQKKRNIYELNGK